MDIIENNFNEDQIFEYVFKSNNKIYKKIYTGYSRFVKTLLGKIYVQKEYILYEKINDNEMENWKYLKIKWENFAYLKGYKY